MLRKQQRNPAHHGRARPERPALTLTVKVGCYAGPADTPSVFSRRSSFIDLTLAHCMWLARQEGFAGRLIFDGQHFEWIREIDFQPPAALADAGSLHWEGETLVECGRDIDYIEHWHRAPSTSCATVTKTPHATLIQNDPYFMYARDRISPLTTSGSLSEQVASVTTVQQAQALIDCEISFGINGVITASTLPFRVGQPCSCP